MTPRACQAVGPDQIFQIEFEGWSGGVRVDRGRVVDAVPGLREFVGLRLSEVQRSPRVRRIVHVAGPEPASVAALA